MFFLLELSVAYFCFFKFLMAIECGRDLLDCKLPGLKITPETSEQKISFSIPHLLTQLRSIQTMS